MACGSCGAKSRPSKGIPSEGTPQQFRALLKAQGQENNKTAEQLRIEKERRDAIRRALGR